MLTDLQKIDLYHINKMEKCFEGDCFMIEIHKRMINTEKEIYKLLDDICIKETLFAIGESWRKVDFEHGKKLLHAALAIDLAYGGTKLGKKKIQKLMKVMVDKIDQEDNYCFTNWADDPWKEETGKSWNGITQHTFDIAVVLMDSSRVIFMYTISED